ncbi:MAG: hypothetical protein JWM90_478 [Thermoleophilia bacterium]|nr:hypothetical protein [Thermoleophilia bacterium]
MMTTTSNRVARPVRRTVLAAAGALLIIVALAWLAHVAPSAGAAPAKPSTWTGTIHPRTTGTYLLRPAFSTGVRVWVSGRLVFDGRRPRRVMSTPVKLRVGQARRIRVEVAGPGAARAAKLLRWRRVGIATAARPLDRLPTVRLVATPPVTTTTIADPQVIVPAGAIPEVQVPEVILPEATVPEVTVPKPAH